MIIKRIVKDVEGNLEATLMLSPEQAAYLINMGLVTVVTAGTAVVEDMSEEEFQAQIEKAKGEETAEGNSGVTVDLNNKSIN